MQKTKSINGIQIPSCLQTEKERDTRLNGREVKATYNFLIDVYGAECNRCSKNSDEVILEIDHIDGNKKNHYWKNLQLLCKSCNCKKRNQQVPAKKIKLAIQKDLKNMNGETNLKQTYFPLFLDFIENEFKQKNRYSYKDLITDASVDCGFASEETIKRYVKQITSSRLKLFRQVTDERTGVKYVEIIVNPSEIRNKIKW